MRWGISSNIFFLGVVSFLTDISTEMSISLLPLFLVNVLGVGMITVGFIEGVAETTAMVIRVFSGYLSDVVRKRKLFALLGYGLSAISRPFLILASSWGAVFLIRFSDRLGKGVRTAPRDALVAASAKDFHRGRGFGFHRALDTYGAMLGLFLAAVIVFLSQRGELLLSRETFQKLVLVGVIPGFLGVIVLAAFVREVPFSSIASGIRFSLTGLDINFKFFLGVITLFSLGFFSQAFMVLRGQQEGFSPLHILLLLVLVNLVYGSLSFPAGVISDRLGRKKVLRLGWLILVVVYLGLAFLHHPLSIVVLFILYGVFYGLTEGVGRAFVADLVPPEVRGKAYGLYHGFSGGALLPASVIAGILWQKVCFEATFIMGAILVGMAALLLSLVKKG